MELNIAKSQAGKDKRILTFVQDPESLGERGTLFGRVLEWRLGWLTLAGPRTPASRRGHARRVPRRRDRPITYVCVQFLAAGLIDDPTICRRPAFRA